MVGKDSKSGDTGRWLHMLDVAVAAVSWTTIAGLVVLAAIHATGCKTALDGSFAIMVLSAAAVGYLTNYLAIQLLFRPYRPVSWFFNLQGVLPREQGRLAQNLGDTIPEHLLDVGGIVSDLGESLVDRISSESFLNLLRRETVSAVRFHLPGTVATLRPMLVEEIRKSVGDYLTPKTMLQIYDTQVRAWIDAPENREAAGVAVGRMLSDNIAEISTGLKQLLRRKAGEYFTAKLAFLGLESVGKDLAEGLVNALDWRMIRGDLSAYFTKPEFRAKLSPVIDGAADSLHDYIASDRNAEALGAVSRSISDQLAELAGGYIDARLGQMLVEQVDDDALWNYVGADILPKLTRFAEAKLTDPETRSAIVDFIDLPGRIRNVVEEYAPKDIHALVNRVSGEHLVRLQLLGYLLGAIVGTLMYFV